MNKKNLIDLTDFPFSDSESESESETTEEPGNIIETIPSKKKKREEQENEGIWLKLQKSLKSGTRRRKTEEEEEEENISLYDLSNLDPFQKFFFNFPEELQSKIEKYYNPFQNFFMKKKKDFFFPRKTDQIFYNIFPSGNKLVIITLKDINLDNIIRNFYATVLDMFDDTIYEIDLKNNYVGNSFKEFKSALSKHKFLLLENGGYKLEYIKPVFYKFDKFLKAFEDWGGIVRAFDPILQNFSFQTWGETKLIKQQLPNNIYFAYYNFRISNKKIIASVSELNIYDFEAYSSYENLVSVVTLESLLLYELPKLSSNSFSLPLKIVSIFKYIGIRSQKEIVLLLNMYKKYIVLTEHLASSKRTNIHIFNYELEFKKSFLNIKQFTIVEDYILIIYEAVQNLLIYNLNDGLHNTFVSSGFPSFIWANLKSIFLGFYDDNSGHFKLSKYELNKFRNVFH